MLYNLIYKSINECTLEASIKIELTLNNLIKNLFSIQNIKI